MEKTFCQLHCDKTLFQTGFSKISAAGAVSFEVYQHKLQLQQVLFLNGMISSDVLMHFQLILIL